MKGLVLGAVLLVAGWAEAQCCGDCGGDGQVTINELVVAVNNALNNCSGGGVPTPTPPGEGCPIDFSDDNTVPGTPDCYYVGRWNETCGDDDLEALWRSDSEFVIIEVLGFDPDLLFLGASVTGPGTAELICWFTQLDASDCEGDQLIEGTVTLGGGGATLTAAPTAAPFTIDDCPLTRYDASLTDVITPPELGRSALRRVGRAPSAALQRLRSVHAARPSKPSLRRSR